MINANELRIGNWVNIPECWINVQVNAIRMFKFSIDRTNTDIHESDNFFKYESANPIPLTPEILEKAGLYLVEQPYKSIEFLKRQLYACDELAIDVCFRKGNPFFVRFNRLKISINDSKLFNNVHQLQNLVYALTGTELEINLNP